MAYEYLYKVPKRWAIWTVEQKLNHLLYLSQCNSKKAQSIYHLTYAAFKRKNRIAKRAQSIIGLKEKVAAMSKVVGHINKSVAAAEWQRKKHKGPRRLVAYMTLLEMVRLRHILKTDHRTTMAPKKGRVIVKLSMAERRKLQWILDKRITRV
jgi:hypothetical protein